jgi:hypothetical protein
MCDHAYGSALDAGQTPDEHDPFLAAPQRPGELQPIPLPPDWWRCLRRGGVSGRYEGTNGKFGRNARALDLRIDIDPRSSTSPVMHRVSGDFYRVHPFAFPFPVPNAGAEEMPSAGLPVRPLSWRTYLESWIVDAPKVTVERCRILIEGRVRFWKGVHLETTVSIVVTWGLGQPMQAVATFKTFLASSTFTCERVSDCFRSMTLEVDVCESVNSEPVLPEYGTGELADRPADTLVRTLDLPTSFREAGICVSLRTPRTIIDDGAASFSSWSVAELHDAMELHYSRISASWPRWDMWGLLAGKFDNSGVAGIMFDAGAAYGGSGEPPERQGFAVFRKHSWFNDLEAGAPTTDAERQARRTFLYTWVHEAGHAFNLLHSWNKGRPDSRSWMNYPHNIAGFYDSFYFRFDDEELIHMRHGDRAAVIMGGDAWASGGHLEDSQLESLGAAEGPAPLEVLLRAKGYFDFLEPVQVELRLRNLVPGVPQVIDARFEPQHGVVSYLVQRPDGRILEHEPAFCAVGTSEPHVLAGAGGSDGRDRLSALVTLSFGKHGFSFAEPGDYRVRACYRTDDGAVLVSNPVRLRIGRPLSREEDRLAQDLFSRQVGMALAMRDARSPFLESGRKALEAFLDQAKDSPAAAAIGMLLADSQLRPFHRIETPKGKTTNVMRQSSKPDPKKALQMTEAGLKMLGGDSARSANLPHHRVVLLRAACL